MEFYAIIKHNNKIYSWVEHPGGKCKGHCDLNVVCVADRASYGDIQTLCQAMRHIVKSSATHRFKEVHLE